MIGRLEEILQRYYKLQDLVADPAVISNMDEWKKYTKELADMDETVRKYLEYKKVEDDQAQAKALYELETDREMRDMLEEEIYECKHKLSDITDELKILLLPKDPND
ncbi:MAG: PCRF domain-containing protein, partial [Clostridia bacterium]|nr:PCRF domain-containing protein [Clostridia bacterium]